MPTEHKKKKAKKEKTVPMVLVKSEPNDLHPLEHYVDDRVELVRQLFSSLRTKTINSIVPDFLQKKTHEELQEICLEELLGISKKRLTSIINATKCPTDTESSDSDTSDVENVEAEHISLEEISSDSNDELNKPKKSKKHSSKSTKKSATPAAAPKTAASAKPADPKTAEAHANGKATGGKQYSILELLELQARARAIRSQLALEPVTKIELDDSEDETAENIKESESKQLAKEVSTSDTNETPKDLSGLASSSTTNEVTNELAKSTTESTDQPRVPSSRPIRLKRNFRPRHFDEEEVSAPELKRTENTTEKSVETSLNQLPERIEEKADDKKAALDDVEGDSQIRKNTTTEDEAKDDDIIPIIQEPEILCITSSDSEDEDAKFLNKVKRNYITMPTIEKEVRPPTEDELFLEKVKQKTSIEAVLKQGNEKGTEEVSSKAEGSGQSKNSNDVLQVVEEAPEDGEIVEDEPIEDVSAKSDIVNLAESSDEETHSSVKNFESIADENKSAVHEEEESNEKSTEGKGSCKNSDDDTDNEDSTDLVTDKSVELPKRSDDEDEDIIDLGKDEDLDFEIKNDGKPESRNESWDTRWLRNNKVTKVLATAKLQNKVRSKIKEKKTKTTTEIVQKEDSNEPTVEPPTEIPSNVEVGSVEHYKELTKKK